MMVALQAIAAALLVAGVPGPSGPGALDASLRDSHDGWTSLSRFRGKPTVLIYEDKGSTHQNEAVKKELFARGKEHHVMDAANVVAVADLAGYNFFPARSFALRAVRDVEKKHGVQVLVDWNHTLCTPPWGLRPSASSIVLLDEQGRRRFSHSGRMSTADTETLFQTLTALLKVDLGHPSQAMR